MEAVGVSMIVSYPSYNWSVEMFQEFTVHVFTDVFAVSSKYCLCFAALKPHAVMKLYLPLFQLSIFLPWHLMLGNERPP